MLLDRNGFQTDIYTRDQTELANGKKQGLILPLPALQEAGATWPNGTLRGIEVQNHLLPGEVFAYAADMDLVVILFPSFADGRGFSLARRLRRLGLSARLRASGPLIPDQFAYALACGFDEIELPEAVARRQTEAAWLSDLTVYHGSYQRGFPRGQNILDARQAAARGERR